MFHPAPTTRWINPSDCVDMDCDARRKVLFTDIDGQIFGKPGTTVISRSEFGWDGDRKWGLGEYENLRNFGIQNGKGHLALRV